LYRMRYRRRQWQTRIGGYRGRKQQRGRNKVNAPDTIRHEKERKTNYRCLAAYLKDVLEK